MLACATNAQNNVSQYFDDGGVSDASMLFKVGFDPLNGEIPVIFEHRLTKHISVEWGAGPVMLTRQSKLYDDIQNSSPVGFNLWANLRIYLKGYYERFYIGFQPRLNFLDRKTYTDIVFFNCGYQIPLSGRLILDINGGMGVRIYKEDDTVINTVIYENGRSTDFVIPLQLKLGYAF
jgi:hypothetical protein